MASFKSICESFALDLQHFSKIFNVNENHFVVWDTDNNGLIDALELFSGIAIFSAAKFEDIIRCTFIQISFIRSFRLERGKQLGQNRYRIYDIFLHHIHIQNLQH